MPAPQPLLNPDGSMRTDQNGYVVFSEDGVNPYIPTGSPLSNVGINGPAVADPSGIGRPVTGVRQPPLNGEPTINPDGSLGYPYQPGVDPMYDAWLAQYHGQVATNQHDALLKQAQAQQQYQGILSGIGVTADTNRNNLTTNLLQRGVYQSGETGRRGAELQADVLRQQTTAGTNLENAAGGISSDLQRAIAALDLQNVTQIGSAVDRQTAKKIALDKANAPAPVAAAAPAAAPAVAAQPAQVAPTPAVTYSPTPLSHGTTGGISTGIHITKPVTPTAAPQPPPAPVRGQTQTGRY